MRVVCKEANPCSTWSPRVRLIRKNASAGRLWQGAVRRVHAISLMYSLNVLTLPLIYVYQLHTSRRVALAQTRTTLSSCDTAIRVCVQRQQQHPWRPRACGHTWNVLEGSRLSGHEWAPRDRGDYRSRRPRGGAIATLLLRFRHV